MLSGLRFATDASLWEKYPPTAAGHREPALARALLRGLLSQPLSKFDPTTDVYAHLGEEGVGAHKAVKDWYFFCTQPKVYLFQGILRKAS